jgi:uncharacterized membrane protein
MKSLKNEWIIWVVIAIPFFLLAYYWNQIPETIPTHYGIDGKADRWNSKTSLLWFLPILMFFTYALLLAIPKIDPKLKVETMGKKFLYIKLIIIGLISSISSLFVYSSANQRVDVFSLMVIIICVFVVVMGNYLPTVKPNYFIGIRTPWTLSDENNWLKTHRIAGRIYLFGGIILLILNVLLPQMANIFLMFLVGIILLPIFYSLYLYLVRNKQVPNI